METGVIVLLAVAVGAVLGWFAASRGVGQWRAALATREGELRALDEKFRAAIRDLAGASERAARADALADELAATRAEALPLYAELATLKANALHLEEQKRLLQDAQEALRKEFEAAGGRVLAAAQDTFLKRAEARFEESQKVNAERLSTILAPVGERLKSYETQVQALEARRVDAFGQLTGQIEAMKLGAEQVRAEAARLGNSLRNAPKARGRWGEQQLRNVLEQCGLSEHTDFVTEHSVNTEDGRLRPDAIITIPGQKKLVIDAKVSLNAYQDAFEAADEVARDLALKAHVVSMRNHIQTLASKSYQSQFEDAPDYVLMFVPGEHFISAALEQDSTLWEYAFERRVLLASPTNLVAIARSVAQVWRQVGLEKEAREIGRMGGELYDRLAKVTEDLDKLGVHLGRAVGSYNDFGRSFNSRVVVSAKRMRDKHIEVGKREIEEVSLIEAEPRSFGSSSPDEVAGLLPEGGEGKD